MGLFQKWQPEYAAQNVVTFPIAGNKTPAVTHWQKAGMNASRQWALKFPEAEAFAFLAGQRNRITVLDIDTPDERVLADELSRYGETPIVVRSGSGNHQAWYRHNGERRKIRARPNIDILGYGVVVAPPSMGRKSAYQFISGSMQDFDSIPVMRTGADLAKAETAAGKIRQGGRREALLAFLRPQARFCDTFDDLLDIALGFANEQLDRGDGHPFTDAEVRTQAKSVWDWTERGNNWAGQGRQVVLSHDRIDQLLAMGGDVLALYMLLRRHHWGRDFKILNDMRHTMPDGKWSIARIQVARATLLKAGILEEIKQPSSYSGPALYRWK